MIMSAPVDNEREEVQKSAEGEEGMRSEGLIGRL